jgi:hypothetical protein
MLKAVDTAPVVCYTFFVGESGSNNKARSEVVKLA